MRKFIANVSTHLGFGASGIALLVAAKLGQTQLSDLYVPLLTFGIIVCALALTGLIVDGIGWIISIVRKKKGGGGGPPTGKPPQEPPSDPGQSFGDVSGNVGSQGQSGGQTVQHNYPPARPSAVRIVTGRGGRMSNVVIRNVYARGADALNIDNQGEMRDIEANDLHSDQRSSQEAPLNRSQRRALERRNRASKRPEQP